MTFSVLFRLLLATPLSSAFMETYLGEFAYAAEFVESFADERAFAA